MAFELDAIRTFPLGPTWRAIIAPIHCNYYLIIGNVSGKAINRCSDPTNPSSSYLMPPGGWFSMMASRGYTGINPRSRFAPGDIVTYLQAAEAGDTGPVVVEFIL